MSIINPSKLSPDELKNEIKKFKQFRLKSFFAILFVCSVVFFFWESLAIIIATLGIFLCSLPSEGECILNEELKKR